MLGASQNEDAIGALRTASREFAELDLPVDSALTALELADALLASEKPESGGLKPVLRFKRRACLRQRTFCVGDCLRALSRLARGGSRLFLCFCIARFELRGFRVRFRER